MYNKGLKLKEFRHMNNLTQEEVARKLNIERTCYTRMENGKTSLYYNNLLLLCDLYNCTLNDLYGIKKESDLVNL